MLGVDGRSIAPIMITGSATPRRTAAAGYTPTCDEATFAPRPTCRRCRSARGADEPRHVQWVRRILRWDEDKNIRLDWLAEIPWGVIVFLFIAVFGGLDVFFRWKSFGPLDLKDYLRVLGLGAGLLGIGHGIRTQGRTRPKKN